MQCVCMHEYIAVGKLTFGQHQTHENVISWTRVILFLQFLAIYLDVVFFMLASLVAICCILPAVTILMIILVVVVFYLQKVYQDAAQVSMRSLHLQT